MKFKQIWYGIKQVLSETQSAKSFYLHFYFHFSGLKIKS